MFIFAAPVTTLAGSGDTVFSDGTGTSATFNEPSGVAISFDGVFALVADANNNRVRRVTLATGVVTTLAGSSSDSAPFADGTGSAASFSYPSGVSTSPDASFALVVDTFNNRVRHIVVATGEVTTFAGSTQGSADGTGS